ncbi:MAG: serine/threonine-protein kinase [Pirellulaceae bacterium]
MRTPHPDSETNVPGDKAAFSEQDRPVVDDLSETPEVSSKQESVDQVCQKILSYLDPPRHQWEIGFCEGYSLVRMLDRGGMAAVFLAIDESKHKTDNRFALKIMLPSILEKATSSVRFDREVNHLRATSNATHIVGYDRHGESPRAIDGKKLPWLSMKLVKGRTLSKKISTWGRLPQCEVARLGAEIFCGLESLHDEGIIHRDLKPSNILLDIVQQEMAMIVDFGLAKSIQFDSNLTNANALVGTIAYVAPECAAGEVGKVTKQSDLFSVGCILYQALTGFAAFSGKIGSTQKEVPHHPCDVVPGVNRGLAEAILNLLCKSPDDRPQSAREARIVFSALSSTLVDTVTASGPAWPLISDESVRRALAKLADGGFLVPRGRNAGASAVLLGLAYRRQIAREFHGELERVVGALSLLLLAHHTVKNEESAKEAVLSLRDSLRPLSEFVAKHSDSAISFPRFHKQFVKVGTLVHDALGGKSSSLFQKLTDLHLGYESLAESERSGMWSNAKESLRALRMELLEAEFDAAEAEIFVSDKMEATLEQADRLRPDSQDWAETGTARQNRLDNQTGLSFDQSIS